MGSGSFRVGGTGTTIEADDSAIDWLASRNVAETCAVLDELGVRERLRNSKRAYIGLTAGVGDLRRLERRPASFHT